MYQSIPYIGTSKKYERLNYKLGSVLFNKINVEHSFSNATQHLIYYIHKAIIVVQVTSENE